MDTCRPAPGRDRQTPMRPAASKSDPKSTAACRVPANGITTSTGMYVPSKLPSVEMAYMRPLTRPASLTSRTARRMANGDRQPSKVTGMLRLRMTSRSEPVIAPTLMMANAAAASRNTAPVRSKKNTEQNPARVTRR